ncbi:MAG: hypothetical protein PHD76_03470 [Methylacidiphilales bacterium]|nr:hypothetical protein [Candidatus Methylacidiphilales bacterium]
MNNEKKREWATYFKLHLHRQFKSRAKREALAGKGLFVAIGGDTPDRPYLKVLKTDYVLTWQQIAFEMVEKLEKSRLDPADCFNLLRVQIEREVYCRLSAKSEELARLNRQFEKGHGRAMTAREQELYAGAMKLGAPPVRVAANATRSLWLNSVLDKIRRAQGQSPNHLQQAWASLVGTEAAMETVLEKVDASRGLAYCKTLSSARRYSLQRKSDLAVRLGKLLNLNIQKIVFR